MRLLSRAARRRYGLDGLAGLDGLGGLAGGSRVTPAELRALAHAINEVRRVEGHDTERVHAGELGAFLLLQEVLGDLLSHSLRSEHPGALERALEALEAALGRGAVDELLQAVVAEFTDGPGGLEADRLETVELSRPRLAALEALLLLWQLNRNPALEPLRELFDERSLPRDLYQEAVGVLERGLRQATRGEDGEGDLIDRLERYSRQATGSIAEQLDALLEEGAAGVALDPQRVARALDALREERVRPPAGPGPIEVPEWNEAAPVDYSGPPRAEPDWMRELVLTAKHTYVWLDQLSRRYQRAITTLDEVPAAELARLAGFGSTGLWLVGVWERSPASRKIKRLAGDREAEASAYSIFDYEVARELGGREALEVLQERAREHGLRIGVDVVPNHFGLDSRWLRERPEDFLAVDQCPYPGYSFAGPDLSDDPEVGLYLEDHYYDRSDAAVVFKHVDRRSGRERFIYHGNDGTSTPWNDTAQLDYSRPEVRAGMTELIVGLAERFPILRFDAAMTLTRLHFQRLWFPPPGGGGAVPSRSEHGMTSAEFGRSMPTEFWYEVVERINREQPDTLLVAEAFWLMEPFFVRELGMHRVYNSAFMHLLREREDARLARLLRDTASRDPEFLRRSVNFMSTPDEDSAAEQFGTGDRYFGVCTLLATLPGLPLFGHGQVEGLHEKYGMEFRRSRWEEAPDDELASRHLREIAPLLADRGAFAAVDDFRLLDCFALDGREIVTVHGFVAGRGREVRIVAFNNSERPVEGWLQLVSPLGNERERDEATWAEILGEAAIEGGLVLRDLRHEHRFEAEVAELVAAGLRLRLGAWQALVLSVEASDEPVREAVALEIGDLVGDLIDGPIDDRSEE